MDLFLQSVTQAYSEKVVKGKQHSVLVSFLFQLAVRDQRIKDTENRIETEVSNKLSAVDYCSSL